jgi:hypothetical protein
VNLTGGMLTVGTGTITGNTGDGVTASAGTTLVSNTGAQYTNNTGNGIAETSATLTFNSSASAPIVVSGNGGDGIMLTNGNITASYLTLSSNGTGSAKAGLEIATGVSAVNVGIATDAAVSITGNGVGVRVGSPTLGTAIDMRRASITSNLADGIDVDLNWGTTIDMPNMVTKAAFTSLNVSNNTGNGVVVTHAPPLSGAVKLTFDTLTIASNGGIGFWLDGTGTNDVDSSLKNSKVQLNTGVGLKFQQGTGTTQETIQNCDINQNKGGGVLFSTSSTLVSFQANAVHGNSVEQITVSAPQNGGGNWNMRSIGNACDGNRNQIYGYGSASCGVTGGGLLVNSPTTATIVDAQNVAWENAAPGAGTDYVLTGAGGNNVLVASPCTANTACP